MKIKSVNSTLCRKCLEASFSIDEMIRFAKLVYPNYNIYARTGIKEGMPIIKHTASHRIVMDMIEDGYYIDFVETLVKINSKGFMGRKYSLRGLEAVIESLMGEGFIFDEVTGQFFENQEERISSNWGRLKEGDERKMSILRMDIAGNSILVKNNPKSKIEQAYNDIRDIVNRAVTSRFGRLWSWEGDGALSAFLFGSLENSVIYAGMEILHELFFYNRLRNPLDSPIKLRLGAHIGQVWFSNNEMERSKNETVKESMVLESLATNNSLSVSYNLFITMDQYLLNLFSSQKTDRGRKFRLYAMELEK